MNKFLGPLLTTALGISATACSGVAEPAGHSGSKIIGGVEISTDPAVVAIYRTDNQTKAVSLCTGTLVSPTTVVTAAHCVIASDATFRVYSGRRTRASSSVPS